MPGDANFDGSKKGKKAPNVQPRRRPAPKCPVCKRSLSRSQCQHFRPTTAVSLIRPKSHTPRLISSPASSTLDLLSAQIVSYFPTLGPHVEWLELVPRRLGHGAFVDDAAAALLHTVRLHVLTGGEPDDISADTAMLKYGRAVRSLGNSLALIKTPEEADATFAAIALIILSEIMIGSWPHSRRTYALMHWQGLNSLYLTYKDPSQLSDLAHAVQFALWDVTFGIAAMKGLASPFDHDSRWLDLQPPTTCGKSTPAYHLRRLSHSLTIQAARLIRYTRAVRSPDRIQEDIDNALALSSKIYDTRSDDQETALLHRVAVRVTEPKTLRDICPYSYSFRDTDDFNAAILYWGGRLVCLINCITILENCPGHVSSLDAARVERDLERLVTNILMSWTHAVRVGQFATLWYAKLSLPAFGTLRRWKTLRGVPTEKIRAWMYTTCLTHRLNEWLSEDATEEDMDVGFKLLVGGPMDGFIVKAAPDLQKSWSC